jgi:hypothetical protein
MPTTQRRSRPVNGSVLAAAFVDGLTDVLGVVEVGSFVGSLPADGSLLAFSSAGFFSSFEGEVPVLGAGVVGVVFGVGAVWLYPLVPSAARAVAGMSSTAAISAGRTKSRREPPDDPWRLDVAPVFRDLLEATTSIRVMPTSRW